MKTYPVYCRDLREGPGAEPQKIGVVTANNYTHASRKAQQLYNRHAFVRPVTQSLGRT